jgi:hypothetical protein
MFLMETGLDLRKIDAGDVTAGAKGFGLKVKKSQQNLLDFPAMRFFSTIFSPVSVEFSNLHFF